MPKREIIQHPSKFEHYNYVIGPRFDPGAQAEVYLQSTTNPLRSTFGPGRIAGFAAGSMRVLQHPQVYFNQQVRRAGIPTIAGTMYTQPLIDPTNI